MTSTRARAAVLLAGLLLARGRALPAPPEPWVRKIEMKGVTQLGKGTLRDRMELKTWRSLPPDPASSVPGQVEEVYERAGYPRPRVAVSVGEPDARGAVVVSLDVVETPLPRLESFTVDLDGLPFLTSLSTRGKVLYFRLDGKLSRYNRKDLDAGLRKEQRRLRGLGWKNATFRLAEEAAPGGGSCAVTVRLELGPLEKLSGKGIDRSVMRDVTESWKRRNVPLSEGVVTRLTRVAAAGMTERGWTDVEVSASEERKGNERKVVLTARRGVRLSVGAIRFEGAASLPENELRKSIALHEPELFGLAKSRPGPKALEESRQALLELYARSGFPDAAVAASVEGESAKRTVVFRVTEGLRRTIGTLEFPGAAAIPAAELRKIVKLEPGRPYWPGGDEGAAEALEKAYSRRGYDDATVTPRAGEPDREGRVALAFEVSEGPSYVLGDVTVRGNHKTRTGRILSLGDERRGRPLDVVQLAEHQTRLSRLGVFDTVSITSRPVPGSAPPSKSVLVDVVERSTRYVEWGLDLNTQRGLEVATTIGERNLFGQAMSGSLSALVGKVRQNYVLEVGQPSLFGTRLYNGVKATYTWDESYDGFDLQTVGVESGLSWEFRPKQIATLVYRLEDEVPLNVQPDVEADLVPETSRVGSVTPTLSLDGRDDPFLTTKGTYVLGRDKASRTFLGGDSDFDRLEGDVRHFRTFGSSWVVAGAARAGWAKAHHSTSLPIGERFYVGGATTHRGFKEKQLGPKGADGSSLGGTSYLLLNAELRAPLAGPLDGGLFLDVGNAWDGRIDVTDLRWAVGAGLRFRTPIGPLRVDMGYLLDRREGEDRTVFHIAIGHAF